MDPVSPLPPTVPPEVLPLKNKPQDKESVQPSNQQAMESVPINPATGEQSTPLSEPAVMRRMQEGVHVLTRPCFIKLERMNPLAAKVSQFFFLPSSLQGWYTLLYLLLQCGTGGLASPLLGLFFIFLGSLLVSTAGSSQSYCKEQGGHTGEGSGVH